MSVEPVPAGYTSLTPVLCVGHGASAIDFYVAAFGARLVERMDTSSGGVAHAELGATIREPVSNFVTGDRYASIIGPFGHRWAVLTRVEDARPDETDRRLGEWSAAEFG